VDHRKQYSNLFTVSKSYIIENKSLDGHDGRHFWRGFLQNNLHSASVYIFLTEYVRNESVEYSKLKFFWNATNVQT